MSLTHEDIERVLALLEASQFDELHLETGDLKLTLRRRGAPAPEPSRAPPAQSGSEGADPAAIPSAVPSPRGTPDGAYVEVRAPLLGTFYCAPKPGAEPFVRVGAKVQPETVVGIIEVMKLMNSVAAGARGEIVEILARDGQLVEYGQVLMRLRPEVA